MVKIVLVNIYVVAKLQIVLAKLQIVLAKI